MLKLIRVRYLLAAGAIVFAMSCAYQAMHTTEGVVSVATNEGVIASAQFRAPIATLEAQLFAPGPLTMEERIRLAAAIDAMRESLEVGSGSHMAKFSARELRTLAAMSRGIGELGGDDLERVRHNWMRIRSNNFDDASWFRFSEADPVAPVVEPTVALSTNDRETVERLKYALSRLEESVASGYREAEQLGEPRPEGSFEPQVGQAWRDWSVRWDEGLARVQTTMPPAPDTTASLRVRFAFDNVKRALDELSAVPGSAPNGGRPPYPSEWQGHFHDARRALESARNWIAQAESGRIT